jgi:hypothetical protein
VGVGCGSEVVPGRRVARYRIGYRLWSQRPSSVYRRVGSRRDTAKVLGRLWADRQLLGSLRSLASLEPSATCCPRTAFRGELGCQLGDCDMAEERELRESV